MHYSVGALGVMLCAADGELRQPGPDIMQKLSGAKEKLGLRVHGLIVGSPDKKRADPAVLRSLCTNYLPNGKVELCLSEFEGWASVQVRLLCHTVSSDGVYASCTDVPLAAATCPL